MPAMQCSTVSRLCPTDAERLCHTADEDIIADPLDVFWLVYEG
jgi:hypothetical protein